MMRGGKREHWDQKSPKSERFLPIFAKGSLCERYNTDTNKQGNQATQVRMGMQ